MERVEGEAPRGLYLLTMVGVEGEATRGLHLIIIGGAEAGVPVGRFRQEGTTLKLMVKNCHQEPLVTATAPGGAPHQRSELNSMVHIMVVAPCEVKLGGSASDLEI